MWEQVVRAERGKGPRDYGGSRSGANRACGPRLSVASSLSSSSAALVLYAPESAVGSGSRAARSSGRVSSWCRTVQHPQPWGGLTRERSDGPGRPMGRCPRAPRRGGGVALSEPAAAPAPASPEPPAAATAGREARRAAIAEHHVERPAVRGVSSGHFWRGLSSGHWDGKQRTWVRPWTARGEIGRGCACRGRDAGEIAGGRACRAA